MSNRTGLIGMARQGRLDIIAGLLGLLAAIGMLPLQLIIEQVYVRTLPIVLGVASVLYLLAARDESHGEIATFSFGVARILPNIVILGSAGLIAIAALSEARTLLFYDVAAAVGTALFAQILFVDNDSFSPGLLLFEIVLFGLVIRFCALYTTPGYVGIDVWTHMANWADSILEARSLQPISDVKYVASPLYHLLVVGSSLLLNVPLRSALFLVIGLAMPISVVLIYSTATFFVDSRWAVFAAAAYSVSASVIQWGIHIIPTSLGLIFFLAIFYCLNRMLRIDYKPRDYALVVFFSVAVILTHQISAFIMLVLIGSGLLAYVALGLGIFDMGQPSWSRSPAWESVNLTGLLVFDLGLITFMWALTPYQGGDSFLLVLISYFVDTLANSGLGQGVQPTNVPLEAIPPTTLMETVVKYLDVTGFLLLLLLTVIGCLYIIRQENVSHAMFTSVVATVVMLVFVFGFPLFGIETFVPGRWYAFLVAPMAVVGAIGLSYFVKNTQPSVVVVVLLLFVIVFPATSLLASSATEDQPPFSHTQTRYGYSEAELAAVHTLGNISGNKSTEWVTDHPYGTVFDRINAHNVESGAVVNGRLTGWEEDVEHENGTITTKIVDGDTFVYREYQSTGAAFFSNKYGLAYTPSLEFEQACGGRDIVYTNGEVTVCNAPGI